MRFSEAWRIITCADKSEIEDYVVALDLLRDKYGVVGINRKVYDRSSKIAIMRFGRRLRYLKNWGIVKVVIDTGCPECEFYEIVPNEEWVVVK